MPRTATATAAPKTVAEARARVEALTVERTSAEEAAEELRDRLATGDESISATDLMTADAEVERLSIVLDGAEKTLALAVTRQGFTPDLGHALSDQVSKILGVPVSVVTNAPASPPTDLPAAILIQHKKHRLDVHGGSISGDVVIHYFRTALHLPLSERRLAPLFGAQAHGSMWEQGERTLPGGVIADAVRLSVTTFEAIPTIAGEPEEWRIAWFTQAMAGIASEPVFGDRPSGVRIGSGDASDTKSSIVGTCLRHRVLSSGTASGQRRMTLEVSLRLMPTERRWTADAINSRAKRTVEHFRGTVQAGLGRFETAELKSLDPVEGHVLGRVATAVFEFVSWPV